MRVAAIRSLLRGGDVTCQPPLRADRVGWTGRSERPVTINTSRAGMNGRFWAYVVSSARFSPAIDSRFGHRSEDVVRTLERVCKETGYPKAIRVDQRSEFISRDLDLWAWQRGVVLDFSRQGRPDDNAYIEAFNTRVGQE